MKNSEEEAIENIVSEVVIEYWVNCTPKTFNPQCLEEGREKYYSDTVETKLEFKAKLQQRGWTFSSNRGWVCPNCLESTAMPRRQKLYWK